MIFFQTCIFCFMAYLLFMTWKAFRNGMLFTKQCMDQYIRMLHPDGREPFRIVTFKYQYTV